MDTDYVKQRKGKAAEMNTFNVFMANNQSEGKE